MDKKESKKVYKYSKLYIFVSADIIIVMKLLNVLFRISLFLFWVSWTTNANAQFYPCILADSLMAHQSYLKAIEKYDQCYRIDTSNKKVFISIANCYMQLGDYTLAKKYYHQLESDSSLSAEANSKLAIIYEAQQNLPKAIKYYQSLRISNPENPVYLRKLGNLYLQGHEQKQALEFYQKAIELYPRDLLTIQGLSEMYLSSDDLVMADSLACFGILIDSSNIGLQLLKARIRYRTKDYSTSAEILYNLSYKTELNNYYNKLLGYSLMQIDSLDKAIYHLQKSLLNESDPEYALFYMALAYEKKREYQKARWFFEEAIKAGISDNMAQYHRGLARIYSQQNDVPNTLDQYEKSLKYHNDPEVYFYLGNTAEQGMHKKSKAIYYYKKYLESGHHNPEWKSIAKDRIRLLKEAEFMKGNK